MVIIIITNGNYGIVYSNYYYHHLVSNHYYLESLKTGEFVLPKVFEPCSGKGGFLLDIIDRLMDGLDYRIPDEKERYKTIVEQCLYFNVGNTLELDIEKKWRVKGFDDVVGNPPYNNELWAKFVDYSIKNMNKGGYLLYVHPCNWRKPNHKVGNIMKKYDIHYIKIYDIKNTFKLFNCNVRVDWYLLQKLSNNMETLIVDDMNTTYYINIKDKHFIPNNMINIIIKVSSKDIHKLNIIRSHKIISNSSKLREKKVKHLNILC